MNWQTIFQEFNTLQVCIIGDLMLDSYVWGRVERISPEAPVPIVRVQKRENRLGGAGNVALNIRVLGAKPLLFSVIGQDAEGQDLLKILQENGLETLGILQSPNRPTTVKQRIIAGSQQVVRIDAENDELLSEEEQKTLLANIKNSSPRPDVIIFEDYDKGVLSQWLIREVIAWANSQNIPTITDPKKRNFLHYAGVTLFKPNLKELREGLKIDFSGEIAEIKQQISQAKTQMGVQGILLTLSEKGVLIDFENEQHHIPAHIRQIADVSGAGDTVVSIAALALAKKIPPKLLAELANLGGGLVCESVGVVPIDKNRLLAEAENLYSPTSNI